MDITTEDVQNWLLTKATPNEMKLVQDLISLKLQMQFKVGDPVWFDAKTRGIIHGTIVKMNAKSAKVQTSAGVKWTVSPQLLQKETAKAGG